MTDIESKIAIFLLALGSIVIIFVLFSYGWKLGRSKKPEKDSDDQS